MLENSRVARLTVVLVIDVGGCSVSGKTLVLDASAYYGKISEV